MNFYCVIFSYIFERQINLLKRLNVAKKGINVRKLDSLGGNIVQTTNETYIDVFFLHFRTFFLHFIDLVKYHYILNKINK